MRSQEQSKPYRVEVADKMLIKAERLDVEESEYIAYQSGQPSKAELLHLLKVRLPERDYEVINQLNGITIKRV